MTVDDRNKLKNPERRLQWVPVSAMRISERAQRQHNSPSAKAKISHIANEFDPDLFGYPIVSHRDGFYWIVDGAHRHGALIELGWETQLVQCWVYHGIDERTEADKFLSHNDIKPVGAMDKFRVALVAGWPTETDIDRIVRSCGLKIGASGHNAIGCIGAVRKVYGAAGPAGLSATVRVIRDAFGDTGFAAPVTEGVGLFARTYEGKFNETRLITQLSAVHGGVNGLLGDAEVIKDKYCVNRSESVAAAIVEVYNRKLRGSGRLNGWWSTFDGGTEEANE